MVICDTTEGQTALRIQNTEVTTMTKKEMKAAVDKLKMLQNGKAALEGMTETDCLELFGISRAQALANTNAALAKTEQEIFRAEHPLTGIDKKLYDIAAKHMVAVQERGDLEARHCDSEDFIEIPVWGLEAALKDAYEAGRKSK